jgi:YHS domain-containing protein
LDQNVFSQPQVAAAVEQDFVPVRIDADASPALASAFRIDRVPTEFVMTSDGNVLFNPPIPDKPEPYVAQLQNLARHFRQTSSASSPGATAANVNPAYANLPVAATAAAAAGAVAPAAQPSAPTVQKQVVDMTASQTPPAQGNPYVNTGSDPRYGQAQSVYATSPQPAPQQQVAAQPSAPAANSGVNPALAAENTALPTNAMPRSYRNPETAAAPATTAAVAPPVTAAAASTTASAGALATSPNSTAAPTVSAPAPSAVNVTTVTASMPKPQELTTPAGTPPLAFDGFCPVSLKTLNRWVAGDRQYGAVHRGRTYMFAGAQQRDQFLADPDAYSPVFAGLDPVMLIDKQQAVDGKRSMGYRYGDAFYLFSSKESMQKFKEAPHAYAAGVRQAMNRIDAASGGTLRR